MVKKIKIEKAVPDTSVIIEGILSRNFKNFNLKHIIFHEAVLAELESQANKGRETGYLGLEEVAKLRRLSNKHKIKIEYKGSRPGDFEIKFAKSGEIDSLIRDLAFREKATLVTADIVQSKVALAKGIKVYLHKFKDDKSEKLLVEKYFDKFTYSVVLRQNSVPVAIKGKPGAWRKSRTGKNKISKDEMLKIMGDLTEKAKSRTDSNFENERKFSSILKIGDFKAALMKPPFSDVYELVVTRVNYKFRFKDYYLSANAKEEIFSSGSILVFGKIGNGKSTFIRSLCTELISANKKLSVIGFPREFDFPDSTKLSNVYSTNQEIKDVLFFSNPDYVIFDEIKETEDIKLISDLKLAGMSVVFSFSGKDLGSALNRLIVRNDFNLIETIVIVDSGNVARILSKERKSHSKVGFFDVDSGNFEFEIVKDGENHVVIPKF